MSALASMVIPKDDTTVISTEVKNAISQVKEHNATRRKNQKSILVESFKIGRYLKEIIQPSLPYGSWTVWFQNNMGSLGYDVYVNPLRVVQEDMQLWSGWKNYMIDHFSDTDDKELALVDQLDGSGMLNEENFASIGVSKSALQQLASGSVTDETRDRFISETVNKTVPNAGTIAHAKTVKKQEEALSRLQKPSHRKIADTLMEKHDLMNPDIIEMIPSIADNHPDLVEEMVSSGTLFVPGNEESTPVSSLGISDVKKTLNYITNPPKWAYFAEFIINVDYDNIDASVEEFRRTIEAVKSEDDNQFMCKILRKYT